MKIFEENHPTKNNIQRPTLKPNSFYEISPIISGMFV